jgi:large subunit ribosomal protein LP0
MGKEDKAKRDKAAWKAKYFDKLLVRTFIILFSHFDTHPLQECIEEFPKCFIVGVDNVGSKQMQEIRIAMRGHAEILMGKNTMIRKVISGQQAKHPALQK